MNEFKSNPFYMKVYGQYALFTDPMSKGGGEKFTYQLPTYQALKGIVEACYWKPTLSYIINEVKIIKPIKTETKGILSPMKDGKKDLNYHTYLKDVEYLIKFHFKWNDNREILDYDRVEKKHEQILLRSMQRGGRRDIFLGTRECIAYIERLREDDYNSVNSYYKDDILSFGLMFHSFIYPDEAYDKLTKDKLIANFCTIVMENGLIKFPEPKDCTINHNLGEYGFKEFNNHNLTSAEELLEIYEQGGVKEDGLNEKPL